MKQAVFFAATLGMLWGQPRVFEAASIKPDNSGRQGSGISVYPARIKVINSTLKFCIQVAWDVKDFQVSGALGWMDTERYDVDAVASSPFNREELRTMLQGVLADRFGLEIHRETQEKAGYAMVAARNGAKLSPPVDDPSIMFSRTASGDMNLKAPNVTLAQLAGALSANLGKTVVDQTGIEGKFNISLQWTPDLAMQPRILKSGEPAPAPPPDAVPGPSIFTALQEELGLKLESRKVPVEVIVIERAHRPSEN